MLWDRCLAKGDCDSDDSIIHRQHKVGPSTAGSTVSQRVLRSGLYWGREANYLQLDPRASLLQVLVINTMPAGYHKIY